MTHLSELRARQIADIIEAYDDQIEDANHGKHDTWDSIRDELRGLGLKGPDVALEVGRLKDAITQRRTLRVNPKKAARKQDLRDGADEYFLMISKTVSRTHEGRNSTPSADWSKGKITETAPEAVEVSGPVTSLEELATSLDIDPVELREKVEAALPAKPVKSPRSIPIQAADMPAPPRRKPSVDQPLEPEEQIPLAEENAHWPDIPTFLDRRAADDGATNAT